WPVKGVLQELAQQAFRMGHRLLRDDYNAGRRTESALAEAIRLTGIIRSARLARNDGQVAKEKLVTGGWPLVVNGAFDFEPAKDNRRLAVFLGERILPATRAGPRTEEATGIGTDHFAGEQPDIE